jgi:hypothetical protein
VRLAGALLAIAIALLAAGTAGGAAPPSPWDGTNPFRCTLQHAGLGTAVPHPEADPYCVDFDKRHQNLTDLGVVDFLSKEPARVAAASDKCFYFQSDHWRGSVVQSDASTKTYEWDGHYFFDKARGEGGVWVTNFNVNGRTADPSQTPGFPPEWAPYFSEGTGGVITHDEVQGDPSCAARAAKEPGKIYAPASPPSKPSNPKGRCTRPSGKVTRKRLGEIALGTTERTVRRRLGAPRRVERGFLRFCRRGGGELRVGEKEDRSGELGSGDRERAIVVLSTAPRPGFAGQRPGRRFTWRHAARVMRYDGVRLYAHEGVLAGVRRGKVSFLAVYDRRRVKSRAALRTYLRRAR